MSEPRYTASKVATKDGSWVLSFRHPLRRDARSRQGLKMRRGLATSDPGRADVLVAQMNALLSDIAWHNPGRRAEAERQFDPIVTRAFFDDLETVGAGSSAARDEALPLPGAEQGYAKVLLVGTTGAGKTSLLRHLIGSHPDNDRFPSTSASRTTISDIEVITSESPTYRAVVTFFSEGSVHTNIHECVADACAACWDDVSDDKIADRLLTHRDLRFRLGYVIGSWKGIAERSGADDWDYGDDDGEPLYDAEADASLPSEDDAAGMRAVLAGYLKRVRSLANKAKRALATELNADLASLTGAEKDEAQDRFEEEVQSLPDFDELVNDILDEVKLRFSALEPRALRLQSNGWPQYWRFDTTDRALFFKTVRRFSSNYAPAFGTLLTPLVDGIRIEGRFFPTFAPVRPKLVLFDGEGLGHVADASASVTSRIAKKFADVDVILLVDSAKAPMLEAPTAVLRAVAASGYQQKLAIAFTHFDLLRGQANLPNFDTQRAHVLSSVHQKLTALREVVGHPAVRAIERDIDQRCFMLGFMDKPLAEKNKGPVREAMRLIDACRSATPLAEGAGAAPVYDTAGLMFAIQGATTNFHERWDAILGFGVAGGARRAHWAEVKALNRRIVTNMDGGEYRDLRPVADLVARLSESITKFLDRPLRWRPAHPSDEEADEALSRVQREVFSRLHDFAEARLLNVPRQVWLQAFNYQGRGSTYERARRIQDIYEDRTPIPGPALAPNAEEFLREMRGLVHEAIRAGGGELVNDIFQA